MADSQQLLCMCRFYSKVDRESCQSEATKQYCDMLKISTFQSTVLYQNDIYLFEASLFNTRYSVTPFYYVSVVIIKF